MQKFDIYKNEKDLKKSLTLLCQGITANSKLKQVIEFFSSTEWKKMKNIKAENRYEIAATYLSQLIGENNFMLYDKGEILYDKDNIFSKMSSNDLKVLKFVDSKGKCGCKSNNNSSTMINPNETDNLNDFLTNGELVINTNDYVMMNIGSTVAVKTLIDQLVIELQDHGYTRPDLEPFNGELKVALPYLFG